MTDKLQEALDKLSNKLTYGNRDTLKEQFFEFATDSLVEKHRIILSEEDNENESFEYHPFTTRYNSNRNNIRIDGSAMVSVTDGYILHLFIVDYDESGTVRDTSKKEVTSLLKLLASFAIYVNDDGFYFKLHQDHPVRKLAEKMRNCAEKITETRLWILTNKRNTDNSSHTIKKEPLITGTVADLEFWDDEYDATSGISQDFSNIGGLSFFELPMSEAQKYRCVITCIEGETLASLYRSHGIQLIEANVRGYLGSKSAVNSGIIKTIEKNPCNFAAYNNGLVISANSLVMDDGRIMAIKGLQIVNGGQTTASLFHYSRTIEKAKTIEEQELRRKNLRSTRVVAKVIVPVDGMEQTEQADLRASISHAANCQNPVKTSDLSANHPYHIGLEKAIKMVVCPDGTQWYYERKRKQFENEKSNLTSIKEKNDLTKRYSSANSKTKQIITKENIEVASMIWQGESSTCAKGKVQAGNVFIKQIDKKLENNLYQFSDGACKIDRLEAIEIIAKHIAIVQLESAVKSNKSVMIRNPHNPVIYAIALLVKHYGNKISFDQIWQTQGMSVSLLNNMVLLTQRVYQKMSEAANKTNFALAMWARKPQCMAHLETIDPKELFVGFDFDKATSLS